VKNLQEDHGKAIRLDHEDKESFSEPIKFLAGLVKAAVDFMEDAEATLAGLAKAERVQAVVGPQVLARQLLKRQVVNRYWGEGQLRGVCWGGCGELMVYGDVQLAHWRLKGELNEGNGIAGATAQVSCISTYCFHSKQVLTTACLLSALAHLYHHSSWGRCSCPPAPPATLHWFFQANRSRLLHGLGKQEPVHTWARYEKYWGQVGKSYQRLRYPDGTLFEPEDDMRPLRLNGVVGKGPDCDYLLLKSEKWHELRKRHLRLKNKTDFHYHQYGVVDGDGDDDDDDEEQDDDDDDDHDGDEEEEVEAMARTLNRLPFLGPIFAVGWPLDDLGGPRNQLKKSQKAGGSA
jgi:hypothetical protein